MKDAQNHTSILIIIGMVLLGSCTEVIDIELDTTYNRLVVFGIITSDSIHQKVQLSTTSDYFFNQPSPTVSGATIELEYDNMLMMLNEDVTQPGNYITPVAIRGVPNMTYQLHINNVDIDGDGTFETYEATSTMPEAPKLDSIQMTYFQSPFVSGYQVFIYALDPPSREWYSFKIWRNNDLLTDSLSKYSVQTDDFYNGDYIYGLPVDMAPVLALAEKYGLRIIEDAAEMHGQTYKGKPCGNFGDISTFSFYPNKHITTGEGGMIVTDNEELAERCRSLRNLCFQPKKRFVHEELGWNFRFSNLQAALGLAQLEKLDEHIKRKRRMGKLYTELLTGIPELQLPLAKIDYAENIYWVFGIVLKNQIPFDAEEAMRRLKEKGIGTRPFFWPMHEQPVFRKMGLFTGETYPVAERIARRGFYIPSGLALTDEQIERSAAAVKEILS